MFTSSYDGDEIDLGDGRSLRAIDSPGHAKHHLGLLDSGSGLLFAGDAVGVRLPDGGGLRPATPPPDFDLDLALASLRRFADQRPTGIALAHYGLVPGDPLELLEEADATLRSWAEEAERAWRGGEDIAGALQARFAEWPGRHGTRAASAPRDVERRPLECGRPAPLARPASRRKALGGLTVAGS